MKPTNMYINLLLFITLLYKSDATPTKFKKESVIEVPFGENVTLGCESNDQNHTFFYWYLNERDLFIGPNYEEYNVGKFKYEVLSGNLTVKAVSKNEEGRYNCVSRAIYGEREKIRSVRMIVQKDWEEVYDYDTTVNLYRTVVVIVTLVLIAAVAYASYRIYKTRFRHPTYLMDDDEEDDSGEELFRTPQTSKEEGTSSISTDFNSILDTANNK